LEFGIFSKDFSERSNPGTHGEHRIEVTASDQIVTSTDLDLPEARTFQNAVHAVGTSERKWAGRVGIVSGLRRKMKRRGPKRHEIERIFLQPAPADERQAAIAFEDTANVAERRNRIIEKHHPKPRESGVKEGTFKGEYLGVGLDQLYSFGPLGRALRERQHRARQIESQDSAIGGDGPGEVQRRITAATTYVQNVLIRVKRERPQSPPTERSELQFQQIPNLCPRAHAYFVLGVRRQRAALIHAGMIA